MRPDLPSSVRLLDAAHTIMHLVEAMKQELISLDVEDDFMTKQLAKIESAAGMIAKYVDRSEFDLPRH